MTAVQTDRLLNCSYITAHGFSLQASNLSLWLVISAFTKKINSILLSACINHTQISGLNDANEDQSLLTFTFKETPNQKRPCQTVQNHQQLKPDIFLNVLFANLILTNKSPCPKPHLSMFSIEKSDSHPLIFEQVTEGGEWSIRQMENSIRKHTSLDTS